MLQFLSVIPYAVAHIGILVFCQVVNSSISLMSAVYPQVQVSSSGSKQWHELSWLENDFSRLNRWAACSSALLTACSRSLRCPKSCRLIPLPLASCGGIAFCARVSSQPCEVLRSTQPQTRNRMSANRSRIFCIVVRATRNRAWRSCRSRSNRSTHAGSRRFQPNAFQS